jgi:hypothetical protein
MDDPFVHVDWTRTANANALDSLGWNIGFGERLADQVDHAHDPGLSTVGSLSLFALAKKDLLFVVHQDA